MTRVFTIPAALLLNRFVWTALLAAAVLPFPSFAQSETALFRDIKYNSPISEFVKSRGYYDCSKVVGASARCIDNVRFLDLTFETQVLVFNQGRLVSVVLATEMTPEAYQTVMRTLPKSFALMAMQSKAGRLDMLELKKKGGGSSALARINEFESTALQNGSLTYIFVEGDFETHAKHATAIDAIMKSSPNSREVSVSVEEDNANTYLRVAFALPRRALSDMKSAPVKTERF
jgi:hypothetical protein